MKYNFFLIILSLLLIQGCIDRRNSMSSDYIQNGGWANAPSPSPEKPEPLYCYKTIASVNCYSSQQIGQENRLIGKIAPPPTKVEDTLVATDIIPNVDQKPIELN